LLGGTLRTRYAHLGAFDTANSDYDDLPALFAAAGVQANDAIPDAGSGKGRVLNWVSVTIRRTRSTASSSTLRSR
jgi:hypothetical protein